LRKTLSERPLEGPVKGEKGLGMPLYPHLVYTEACEALKGAAFAGFPYTLRDLELLDEAVVPLQRFVEGHEFA
jgi:hypothetical protein